MKKSLLLFGFLFLGFFASHAQNAYKLTFTGVSVKDPSPYKDTVYYNEKISFKVFVHNDGTVSGTGNQTFPLSTFQVRYFLGSDFANRKVSWTHTVTAGPIKKDSFSNFNDNLLIDKNTFAVSDTTYIIIIWPSGGVMKGSNDSIDSSKTYTVLQFYLSSKHYSGIKKDENGGNFSIYPNPAKDNLYIQMTNAEKGSLKLTDMSGKLIAIKPFDVNAGENISLPLNEGAGLANGVYFIAIETANYKAVNKIIISK
jgi:hypothetical protein